ncbi:MAG: ATP synthase subunit I [Deltaproteobacteria bacterium]|nr:ATP synthase subunit I [Deltaproteobacteria bacterium]TLN01892.1 MAG: ATP synthase subunit I [bacterium]
MTFYAIRLSLAAVAGLALGLFYFGGLWLTVRKIPRSGNPGILILGSFVVRLLVTLCGMYLVMDGKWELLVACLAGFLLMRIVLTRKLGPGRKESRLSA